MKRTALDEFESSVKPKNNTGNFVLRTTFPFTLLLFIHIRSGAFMAFPLGSNKHIQLYIVLRYVFFFNGESREQSAAVPAREIQKKKSLI